MKKLFKIMSALLCVAGVLTSCENTVELVAPEMGDETHETLTRTPEEAIEIAAQAAIEYSVTESRAMPRLVKQRSLRILGSNPSRSEEDDTLIYVVEYENNEGFALISAKKTTEPILAVVNDGNFQEAMDSEFPVVPDFIQKSKRYISIHDNPIDTLHKKLPTYREERTILADEYVAPKTSNLKWGQEFPEGKYFSNNLSGCGPTALAIGLAYLKFPPQIVITRNGPKELYPLNWEDICKHTQSYSMVEHELGLDCRYCTETRHESIAKLCRQIATNANATSDTLGTSVNRYNLGNAAISLLSSNHVPDNFKSISASGIRSACNSGIALFRGGVDNSNFGHIWVVDGYKYTSTLVRVYEVDNNVISLDGSNEELIDEYREIKFTVSCNWGWNGRYNGYFNSEVMNIPVGKFTPTDILTIKD